MGQKQSSVSRAASPVLYDTAMDAQELVRALEYVSRDLQRKNLHVHLVVGGGSLPCLLYKTKPTWCVYICPIFKKHSR